MNKLTKVLLSVLILMSLCFVFAACTSDTTNSTDSATQSNADTTTASETTAETTASVTTVISSETTAESPMTTSQTTAPNEETMTMDQYIAASQSVVDELQSVIQSLGMNVSLENRDNSLVYSYQYFIDVGDINEMKAALELGMETTGATFEALVPLMRLSVPDAKSIIVEYLDKNGTLIYSKEFI